jgi:hypothetical protein
MSKLHLPYGRRILDENTVSTRLIAGTEWPIMDQLVRDQRLGEHPQWQLVIGLCNGIPDDVLSFRTLRAARAAYESRKRAYADGRLACDP